MRVILGLFLLGACGGVLAGTAVAPAPAVVEFELDTKQAYVRQQVLATARLYVQPNVLATSFSDPVASGAMVEQLGDAEIAEVRRDGVRYQRIERRYALFALRAGELRIQAPVFKGGLSLYPGPALPSGGRLPMGAIRELRVSPEAIRLQVLAPPPDQATHWLPARSLTLLETLTPQTGPYAVGESVVLSIELQVEGQPHAQLPQLDPVFPKGLKVYADPPEGQSLESPRGLTAKQVWRWVLVPTRGGEFELPTIEVRWWDVSAGRERVAQLAAQRIQVSAESPATPDATESGATTIAGQEPVRIWPLAAGAATLGWLLTALAWFAARRRSSRQVMAEPQADVELRDQQHRLKQALRQADAAGTRAALIAWARKRFTEASIVSLDAIAAAGSPRLALELARLDRALYGAGTDWDAQALMNEIDWGPPESQSPRDRHRLRPLYPPGPEALAPEAAPERSVLRRLLFAALALAALVAVAQFVVAPSMKSAATPLSAEAYRALIQKQEETLLDFLRAFETIQDQLHPSRVPQQQRELAAAFGERLAAIAADLERVTPPDERADFHQSWRSAVERLAEAQRIFGGATESEFLAAFFRSRSAFVDGVYQLYALRTRLQRLPEYWRLPDSLGPLPEPDTKPAQASPLAPTGIMHREAEPERSAYSLYVPENYDPGRTWPLIVSLHGSHGSAQSSLLTWLRPAKSRGYLVLAPKSEDQSWSIENPQHDTERILAALDEVTAQYAVDRRRIFATGLSDGGTFSYALGLRCPELLAGIAPVAGVLPPSWALAGATDLPVLIVHGALDHIFPVRTAREAYATLADAGFAQLSYQELPAWGHGFPYAVNDGPVLRWLEGKSRKTEGSCL